VDDVIFAHIGHYGVLDPMVCDVSSVYVSATLEQVVVNFQCIRHGAPRCLTLLAMTTCGALPLVGNLQRAV